MTRRSIGEYTEAVRGRYLHPKGMPFLVFLVGHSLGRFIIMFFRGDPLATFVGLTQAQIFALVILLVSALLLLSYRGISIYYT